MKICIKCGEKKEEVEFNKGRGECKKCMSEYKKKHAKDNAEKISKYQKQYAIDNCEKLKEYQKNYRKDNERLKEYKKQYAKDNSERINLYNKERYNKNEKIRENKEKYREQNKEKSKKYMKEYYSNNKETILLYVYKYKKERKKNDPIYALYLSTSRNIRDFMCRKGYTKTSRTHEILGCSCEEFKLYLELKFETWMTWENKGKYNGKLNYGWDIDHIIPISSAKTEEDVIKLNHYTNFQPLDSYINRVIKRDSLQYLT